MSADGWKKYTLEDIAKYKTGKLNSNAAEANGIYPFFTCSPETLKINSFAFDCEAAILAGNNANGVFCLKYYNGKFNAYQRTYIITADPLTVNIKFIFYQLDLQLNRLQSISHGTATKYLTIPLLNEIEVNLPSIETQTRIASILSALDDKIELNRQTNATLEAIAQAIFKEWFVDFHFPGATGEMQDSELGPIPKGWRVGKIGEICEVNKNTISKRDVFEQIEYLEISGVNRGVISKTTIYSYGAEPSRAKRKLSHGDTVLSTVRPNRGAYFLALNPSSTLIASTGFAVFSPITVPSSFLYLFLTASEQLEYYGHVADGGAYPAINSNLIIDIDLVVPSTDVLNDFQSIVESLFEALDNNNSQSTIIAQTRDVLLPKLMSGEIEV